MNLHAYLEAMSRKEMKAAAEAGQSNLVGLKDVEKSAPVVLPDWFIKDMKQVLYVKQLSKYNKAPDKFNIRNELSSIIFDADKVPIKNIQYIRVVATPKKLYWCDADKAIHGGMILYMMVDGALPMKEEFSRYRWGRNAEFAKDFICLSRKKGVWAFAESYNPETNRTLFVRYKHGELKQYKNIFDRLNIKKFEETIYGD